MRLIPKAKPVRIRITSGNEEHFSLESLRKNFVWADIKKLFEGDSLDKWLRRIEATGIADRLGELAHPEENPIEVYNILFRGDRPFESDDEIRDEFENDRYLESLIIETLPKLDYTELIRCAQKYQLSSYIYKQRIVTIAESLTDVDEPKEIFEVGKFLYESGYNTDLGIKNIQEANNKGHQDASDFITANFDKLTASTNSFFNQQYINQIFSNKSFIEQIKKSWESQQGILKSSKNIDGYSDGGWFKFSDICLQIFREYRQVFPEQDYYGVSPITSSMPEFIHLHIMPLLNKIKENDIFYPDAVFLKALFSENRKEAMNNLTQIKDIYGAAKYLIDTNSSDIQITLDGIKRYYRLLFRFTNIRGSLNSNVINLQYFVLNLKEFRNYEPGK